MCGSGGTGEDASAGAPRDGMPGGDPGLAAGGAARACGMSTSNVCWGIELGAGALKAVKLRASGDEVEVLDFAVIPHKRVLSTPDIDQAEMTNMAMRTLASQFDLTGAGIAISVPGHSAFARFAKLPPV